ncbi:hypothetical protein G210_5498 [Candida maltosa Xu316]|uniref:Beta-mannosyltransferase n=1 Tax=Candida maltosa (strain Xu316) TaxID=1245528 RepID=M3K6W9_CANMX|nr:hypothetical protein G210_5498 [Candida maltosa Xu316]
MAYSRSPYKQRKMGLPNLFTKLFHIKKSRLTFTILCFITCLLIFQLLKYNEPELLEKINMMKSPTPETPPGEVPIPSHPIDSNTKFIYFPSWTPLSGTQLTDYYTIFLERSLPEDGNYRIIKHEPGDQSSSSSTPPKFSPSSAEVFKSGKDDTCTPLSQTLNFETSDKHNLNSNLTQVVLDFINSGSDYYKELEPFLTDIPNQIRKGTIDQHWFQMVGTSVFLKHYGLNFFVSRILYSPSGVKNQPLFSFLYGQIFDKNWNEYKDIEILIPDEINESMKVVSYPGFLNAPTYHDYMDQSYPNYGPEDPRLILIQNKDGYEEPVIIFNSFHRKIAKVGKAAYHYELEYEYFRSMFLGYPWKTQNGKANVDEADHNNKEYIKAIELKISNTPRQSNQKNWTPMLSHQDRVVNKYDTHIYFVYRWSNLEVLQCSLSEPTSCKFVYKMNPQLDETETVGPLRGGTSMINIQHVKPDLQLPSNKEIWVGFPRAHLVECGCGSDMYRPNLAVITKTDSDFKISHISSFLSLNVKPEGWTKDNAVCDPRVPSVVLPNGISRWEMNNDNNEDTMTLSFSISDSTVDFIHIKGLLKGLLDESFNILEETEAGGNVNIDCALQGSKNYCTLFGKLNGM